MGTANITVVCCLHSELKEMSIAVIKISENGDVIPFSSKFGIQKWGRAGPLTLG